MRNLTVAALALLLAVAVTGCGKTANNASEQEALKVEGQSPVESSTPAPEAEPPQGEEGKPMEGVSPAEADSAELHQELVGTKWQVGDVHAEFRDKDTVFLKGGAVTSIAPNGMEASYTYNDGIITVNVAGEKRTGTWDGKTLIVDGQIAEKLS